MCTGTKSTKAFLTILSLVFWGAAAGLMFMGAWIYKEYHNYNEIADAKYILVPATITMACGVFLFLLGMIGCIGAFKEQKCLLALFFSVLLIIFVGLVAGSALAYVYRDEVKDNVRKGVEEGLQKYGNDTVITHEMDFVQSHLQCCGNHSAADWIETPWYKHMENKTVIYPTSCCKDGVCMYPPHGATNYTDANLYTDGCYDKLFNQFHSHLGIVSGVGAAFAIIQILGMVCSCVLICRRKSEVPYIGLNEPTGMRV
jgi:tetraspanin-3